MAQSIWNTTQWHKSHQKILAIIYQCSFHDDVIKWKHFPRYWPFVRGIHRSPVNSPHKGQCRGALMFSLTCVWSNGWVNNREPGDLRRYHAHCDVILMYTDYWSNTTHVGQTVEHVFRASQGMHNAISKQFKVLKDVDKFLIYTFYLKMHCYDWLKHNAVEITYNPRSVVPETDIKIGTNDYIP